MNFKIEIDVSNAIIALKTIQQTYNPVAMREWATNNAKPYAKQVFNLNFASEGGYIGPRWKRLADSTRKERTRMGFGSSGPILVRTGKLKKAVVEHSPIITTYPDLNIEWGSNITGMNKGNSNENIFAIHQQGGSKMPQRKMIGFNPENARYFTKSLYGWIGAKLRWGGSALRR